MAKIEEMKKEMLNPEVDGNDSDVKDEPNAGEKKPNVFVRCWRGIKTGIGKVRENPVAAAIGAVVGSVATIGVTAYVAHKRGQFIQDALPEPEDDGYEYEIEMTEDEPDIPEEPTADEE